jgi:hypothetical protein
MGSHSSGLFAAVENDLEEAFGKQWLDDLRGLKRTSPECSAREFAAAQLHKNLLKKFQDSVGADADAKALSKFLAANERCRDYSLEYASWEAELVGTFKKVLYEFYLMLDDACLLSFNEILSRGRMGPGSSIQARGTDGFSKLFASPLSFTSKSLLDTYRITGCHTPRWRSAEIIRAELLGDGVVTTESKLSFVPKSSEISRTICTEPSLNMYYQLGFGSILEWGLRRMFGIDLSTQPELNSLMAWSGSLTGQLCTVDLESASDSVSLGMLKACLPRQIFGILETLRTPNVRLPDGTIHPLYMVSTMGNGFTFPLQTLIFASAVKACYLESGITTVKPLPGESNKAYLTRCDLLRPESGVFGDDIIVDVRVYQKLVRLLQILGFRVNADKSFFEGPFRESCGYDYYSGRNVRAVYLKTLVTKQDRYSAFNRLALWSSRHVRLDNALLFLLRTVPLNEIPIWEAQTSGIAVPWDAVTRRRFDRKVQSPRFMRWEPSPKAIAFKDDGTVSVPRGHKPISGNPPGAEVLMIGGFLRNHRISVRHDRLRWRRRMVVAPDWDNYRSTVHFDSEQGWRRWTTVVSDVMSRSTLS